MMRSSFSRNVFKSVSFSFLALAAVAVSGPESAYAQTGESLFFDPLRPGFESPGGSGSATGGGGTWTVEKDFTALDVIRLGVDSVQIPAGQTVTIQVDEGVFNDTGIDWTDFHLEVEPIDAPQDLLVQFNNVTFSGPGFTTMTMDNALWIFGSVPTGDTLEFQYEMDVSSVNGGFALYAVAEHPTIPEPSTLLLLALCGVAGVGFRRR